MAKPVAPPGNGGSGNKKLAAVADEFQVQEHNGVAGDLFTNDQSGGGLIKLTSVTVEGTTYQWHQMQSAGFNDMKVLQTESGKLLYVNDDGAFQYYHNNIGINTPETDVAIGETHTETISYTVTDGKKTSSADVSFVVHGQNSAPFAENDSVVVTEGGPAVTGNVLLNDIDPDGDTLDIYPGYQGTFDLGAAILTLQANGDYSVVANPNYDVPDGETLTAAHTYPVRDGGVFWHHDWSTINISINADDIA